LSRSEPEKPTHDVADDVLGEASGQSNHVSAEGMADQGGLGRIQSVSYEEVEHGANERADHLDALAGPDVRPDAYLAPVDHDDVVVVVSNVSCNARRSVFDRFNAAYSRAGGFAGSIPR